MTKQSPFTLLTLCSVCLDACPPIIHPTHPFLHLFICSPSSLHQELSWHTAAESQLKGQIATRAKLSWAVDYISPLHVLFLSAFFLSVNVFVPVLQIECAEPPEPLGFLVAIQCNSSSRITLKAHTQVTDSWIYVPFEVQ